MPVSFGLRDKDNEKINAVLKQLVAITHVPENWNEIDVEEHLQNIELTMQSLLALSTDNLLKHLAEYHFDFENLELLADWLSALYKKQGFDLKDKAIAIYNFIQRESKMFSFEIAGKVNYLR